ncbi:hypothetical protein [Dyadobacter frigoris]|uniref:Outer membrane protein beta-barrel domain-containing protein n=1 Tax=Dyadobacter frigoris TaxID=2576211 RepID=A0A4U6DAL7_9BACT|nr:hypothetical protein [Dyadobacter frigoris]TKT93765.1 hypothetical protein FDK13_00705 [Dyadobacter frigoris]
MKKNLFLIFFLICNIKQAISQNTRLLPTQSLKLNIGRGKLGTGDIQGLMLGVEYERYFQKRLSWSTELGMTIHDGSDLLLVTEASGEVHDLSYRYTTAGAQLVGKIGYYFLRTKNWDMGVRIGGLFRYQSSSVPDDVTMLFPIATGLPVPIFINENTSPQRTYSVGGISQLFVSYTIKQKILLGLTTGLQLDTNGDTIFPQLSFTIGRRF